MNKTNPAHFFITKLHTITIYVVHGNIPKATLPPASHSTQHQQFPPAVITVSFIRENPKQFSDYIALSPPKLPSPFQFPQVELSQLSCACVKNNAFPSVYSLENRCYVFFSARSSTRLRPRSQNFPAEAKAMPNRVVQFRLSRQQVWIGVLVVRDAAPAGVPRGYAFELSWGHTSSSSWDTCDESESSSYRELVFCPRKFSVFKDGEISRERNFPLILRERKNGKRPRVVCIVTRRFNSGAGK